MTRRNVRCANRLNFETISSQRNEEEKKKKLSTHFFSLNLMEKKEKRIWVIQLLPKVGANRSRTYDVLYMNEIKWRKFPKKTSIFWILASENFPISYLCNQQKVHQPIIRYSVSSNGKECFFFLFLSFSGKCVRNICYVWAK